MTLSDAQKLDQKYANELAKLEEFHSAALISEEQYQNALMLLKANKAIEIEQYKNEALEKYQEQSKAQAGKVNSLGINEEDKKNAQEFADALSDLGSAMGDFSSGMSEASGTYKALFATQKAFAVASATANAILAWSQALSDPSQVSWFAKLGQYASAIALTGSIISQLNSVTMHDKGGKIPSGQFGIVGEYGPELVTGPADVTSRRKTADLARQAVSNRNGGVTVNLYEDAQKAGQVEEVSGADNENIINIFVSNIRHGGAMAKTIENTYQLRRYGA